MAPMPSMEQGPGRYVHPDLLSPSPLGGPPPPPPVFGNAGGADINLEDVFSDYVMSDVLNAFHTQQGPAPYPYQMMQQSMPQHQPAPQQLPPPQPPYQPHYQAPMMPHACVQQELAAPPPTMLPYQPPMPVPIPAYVGPMAPAPVRITPAVTTTTMSAKAGRRGVRSKSQEDDDDDDDYEEEYGPDKRQRTASERRMDRKERNREHAKRSRVRKKFLLDSLQKTVDTLRRENNELKGAIRNDLGEEAEQLFTSLPGHKPSEGCTAADPSEATRLIQDPDYALVKALQVSQQSFLITDPTLPDNPIVYASQGFLDLTGFPMDQILGRNCRFLQGPETDPASVDKIRKAIEEGKDGSVCLINYREDGSTFWNQFFIAPLRGADGTIVNYVGVQCKVEEEVAKEAIRLERDAKELANAAQGQPLDRATED